MLQKVSPSCRGKNIEALVQCSGGDCLPDWGRGCVSFVGLRRLLRRSLGVRSYVASLTFSQAVCLQQCDSMLVLFWRWAGVFSFFTIQSYKKKQYVPNGLFIISPFFNYFSFIETLVYFYLVKNRRLFTLSAMNNKHGRAFTNKDTIPKHYEQRRL